MNLIPLFKLYIILNEYWTNVWIFLPGVENAATSSVQDLAAEKEEANTMETFRDFVEKIVVGLIGNMDVPINRVVYHHSPCKLKHIEILYKHVYTNCFYLSLVYTRKFYPVLLILFFFFLNFEIDWERKQRENRWKIMVIQKFSYIPFFIFRNK